MKNVAIMGLSHDSRGFAPRNDPDWIFWGLPWDSDRLYYSALIDMHDQVLNQNPSAGMPRGYRKELGELDVPIYMQKVHEDIPMSREFPFDEVNEDVFKDWGTAGAFPQFPVHTQEDWYGSHIAYLLALAIFERRNIGLFGVDITQQRFDHDRPNLCYLIGLARGRGLDVYVPPTSHMFDMKRMDKLGMLTVEYPKRYGFLKANPKGASHHGRNSRPAGR